MELSLFLAQLFGLTLIIFALVALMRPAFIESVMRDLQPYSFSLLLAGFIGIVGGLAIVLTHNVWEFSWRGLITLFGWSAIAKGVSYVAFPDTLIATAGSVLGRKRRKLVLVIMLAMGMYLTYHGFGLGM
jgi:hypothetical protein